MQLDRKCKLNLAFYIEQNLQHLNSIHYLRTHFEHDNFKLGLDLMFIRLFILRFLKINRKPNINNDQMIINEKTQLYQIFCEVFFYQIRHNYLLFKNQFLNLSSFYNLLVTICSNIFRLANHNVMISIECT